MFNIDVSFERTAPVTEIAEIQKAYLSGMTLDEAKEHFGDFMLCNEAALCLAIDRGWNIDAAIAENIVYVYDYFYNSTDGADDLCGDIVTEAIKYIHDTQSQVV